MVLIDIGYYYDHKPNKFESFKYIFRVSSFLKTIHGIEHLDFEEYYLTLDDKLKELYPEERFSIKEEKPIMGKCYKEKKIFRSINSDSRAEDPYILIYVPYDKMEYKGVESQIKKVGTLELTHFDLDSQRLYSFFDFTTNSYHGLIDPIAEGVINKVNIRRGLKNDENSKRQINLRWWEGLVYRMIRNQIKQQ